MSRGSPRELPREIADGVWWIGDCLASAAFDRPVHFHTSAYVVVGSERTLLFDTGPPGAWETIAGHLDRVLDGRRLDHVVPSHPEIPHAGSLDRVLDRHPEATVVGDVRDYHLYFPDHADRLRPLPAGTEIDLGGGHGFVLLDAVIEDLPTTVWGYATRGRTLFCVDALGYGHLPQQGSDLDSEIDEPVHHPGECALLTSELDHPPPLDLATHLTRSSLYWSRFVDVDPYFARFDELLTRHPAQLLAPAHGSVVDDLDVVMPVLREAHRQVFAG